MIWASRSVPRVAVTSACVSPRVKVQNHVYAAKRRLPRAVHGPCVDHDHRYAVHPQLRGYGQCFSQVFQMHQQQLFLRVFRHLLGKRLCDFAFAAQSQFGAVFFSNAVRIT